MQKQIVSQESLEYLIINDAPFPKIKRAILQSGVHYIDKDRQTRPALHLAAQFGKEQVVKFLLDSNAAINELDHDRTALQVSIRYQQESCFRILIERNADVNFTGSDNELPIFQLLQINYHFNFDFRQKNLTMLCLLLEAGADVNAFSSTSETVLMCAIKLGYSNYFKKIMSYKPNLNLRNRHGQTALHIAVYHREANLTMIKDLITGGAGVNARDANGNTVLHYSLIRFPEIDFDDSVYLYQLWYLVDLLSRCGADINAQNKQQITPLHLAMGWNCHQDPLRFRNIPFMHSIADILIDAGAWLNVCCFRDSHIACRVQDFDLIKLDTTPAHTLLIRKRNFGQLLQLFWSNKNILNEFLWLISRNVDVDMRSREKQSLLHRVIQIDDYGGQEW